jgi:cytochrome c-type biogenesis protein CcmH
MPVVYAADARFEDSDKQERYTRLVHELRCLVCQNQTIADSNAELATDLRNKVGDMIEAGMTDAEIIEFLTSRYGDFVLYRPPMQGNTLLLWIGPFLLLGSGLIILIFTLKRRAASAEPDTDEPTGTDNGDSR